MTYCKHQLDLHLPIFTYFFFAKIASLKAIRFKWRFSGPSWPRPHLNTQKWEGVTGQRLLTQILCIDVNQGSSKAHLLGVL